MAKTTCPGSLGHVWVLHKQESDIVFAYTTRRTLFKKRLVADNGIHDGHMVVQGFKQVWYCTRCRQWDDEYTPFEENSDENLLAKGYAVHGKLPELTRYEYIKKMKNED